MTPWLFFAQHRDRAGDDAPYSGGDVNGENPEELGRVRRQRKTADADRALAHDSSLTPPWTGGNGTEP
jgi:hypothetical protein